VVIAPWTTVSLCTASRLSRCLCVLYCPGVVPACFRQGREDDCSEVNNNTVSVDPSPDGYANNVTFLSLRSIVNMLSSNASDVCVHSEVPNGCKSDLYFDKHIGLQLAVE